MVAEIKPGGADPSPPDIQEDWAMRIVLLLSLLTASADAGLVLDTILPVPDPVEFMYLVPAFNKLYAGGRSARIYVFNCEDEELTGIISPSGFGEVYPYPAWAAQHNKLYFPVSHNPISDESCALAVVDVTTDSLLKVIELNTRYWGSSYFPIAWNSALNKIYVSCYDSLLVIDGNTDSISKVIHCEDYILGGFVFWDSVDNCVYVGSEGWASRYNVTVIDCATDSIVAVIPTRVFLPCNAVYSPKQHKLYVGGAAEGNEVAVIDCSSKRLIGHIRGIAYYVDYFPAYASAGDKIYWPAEPDSWDVIITIDCQNDSITGTIDEIAGMRFYFCSQAYSEECNHVYISFTTWDYRRWVAVLNSKNDSVLSYLSIQARVFQDMLWNPVNRKVYLAGYWDSCIYVFRDSLVGVEERGVVSSPAEAEPTLVRSILYLPERAGAAGKPVLVDITGRRVRELVPGANDVRGLTPGVYFVRSNAGVERKVVIAR
ncbi:MAG: hypothetical protein ABIK11_07475 [candidate division WOR-3 bacterium]